MKIDEELGFDGIWYDGKLLPVYRFVFFLREECGLCHSALSLDGDLAMKSTQFTWSSCVRGRHQPPRKHLHETMSFSTEYGGLTR